jgi:hypothetical protein
MTHRIWRISTVLGATVLTLVAGSRLFQAAGKPGESQIWGSWYVVFHAGPHSPNSREHDNRREPIRARGGPVPLSCSRSPTEDATLLGSSHLS